MKNNKGFTLIELLVVIAIIAVLATGAVTVYTGYIARANDSARVSAINTLNSASAVYFTDQSNYPPNDSQANYVAALTPEYVQAVPNAVGDNNYVYATASTPGDGTGTITGYEYGVALEQDTDKMEFDGGNSDDRYEVGSDLTIITAAGTAVTTAGGQHGLSWDNEGTATLGDSGL